MNPSYTTSVHYEHIHVALQSFWVPFNDLLDEMATFKPRPLSDFDGERQSLYDHLRNLNPTISDTELWSHADSQIKSGNSDYWQFQSLFSKRFMTMYVTNTLLSHALCEAEINAFLAVGLFEKGLANEFAKIERNGLRSKWLNGPTKYCPQYVLDKNSALYKTLDHLCNQRNSWMHHKSELYTDEKKIIEGSELLMRPYLEDARWLMRFFSLPYDLAQYLHAYAPSGVVAMMFFKRAPIAIAVEHKQSI